MAIYAEDLTLFAINTGEFYNWHMRLAEFNAGETEWHNWVQRAVVPRYRKELRITDTADRYNIARAAVELREYYRIAVAEAKAVPKLEQKCAHCGEPLYAIVRVHHHTENGKDVTKAGQS